MCWTTDFKHQKWKSMYHSTINKYCQLPCEPWSSMQTTTNATNDAEHREELMVSSNCMIWKEALHHHQSTRSFPRWWWGCIWCIYLIKLKHNKMTLNVATEGKGHTITPFNDILLPSKLFKSFLCHQVFVHPLISIIRLDTYNSHNAIGNRNHNHSLANLKLLSAPHQQPAQLKNHQ